MAEFTAATQQSTPDERTSDAIPDAGKHPSRSPKAEVHINSDEISAVLAQSLGNAGGAALTPDSNIGSGAPTIKDQQVSFDGDLVHGQFLTEIAGKDVWVTISGHSETKMVMPVRANRIQSGRSQRSGFARESSAAEEVGRARDRLKLPDGVGSMKVENRQLVMQQNDCACRAFEPGAAILRSKDLQYTPVGGRDTSSETPSHPILSRYLPNHRPESFIVRRCVLKSTYASPKRWLYPSAHSKLSIKLQAW